MGVFEFATVAVVLTFVFKVVQLHYASRDRQQAAEDAASLKESQEAQTDSESFSLKEKI